MKTLLLIGALALAFSSFSQIPAYVPSSGLIAWHPFNGNANEFISSLSPTSNSATLTTDRFGNTNSAYHFDGSQVIKYGSSHPFGTLGNGVSNFTINFWLNDAAENPSSTNGMIMGSFGWGYFVRILGSKVNVEYINGTWTSYTSSNNITSDCWKMVTITKNGSDLSIYFDATLDTTFVSDPIDSYPTFNSWFGANGQDNNGYYKGNIDDCGAWNRVLNNSEITQLYNNFTLPLPVSAGTDQSICLGDSLLLAGSGGVLYSWDSGVQDNVYFSPTSTNSYIVSAVDSIGCTSSDTVQVLVGISSAGIDVQTACNTYSWIDGNTYTASNNTATWIETNAAGCDSIVTLDLTVSYSNAGTDVQTACDAYTWIDGNTYTASNNTATWVETNAAGCDSVVTLDLTVSYSNAGTDVQTACNTYSWIDGNTYTASNNTATWVETNAAGCDSVVTLDLTVSYSNAGTDVQTACDAYTWIDGNTYTASNAIATHTLPNVAGCDSVVTLNLTINTVNSSVTQAGALLTADEAGATYQWLDCPGMTTVSGANSQSYTAAANGDYAVIVTNNGCSDTSVCYTVTGVGIQKWDTELIEVYPNPSDGNFSIDLGENYQTAKITITDLTGKLIRSETYNESQLLILQLEEPAGVYLLTIESGAKKAVIRLALL
jgi:hypothetical protein